MSTFGCAMSIRARSTMAPSGNSPALMRREEVEALGGGPVAERAVRAGALERAALLADLSPAAARRRRPSRRGRAARRTRTCAGSSPTRSRGASPQSQPSQRTSRLDRLDVLRLLGDRVRVVEAQVGAAAVGPREAEVEEDRLRVADVQEAVRLGREAGDDAAAVPAGREVGLDDLGEEVRGARGVGHAADGGIPAGAALATPRSAAGSSARRSRRARRENPVRPAVRRPERRR